MHRVSSVSILFVTLCAGLIQASGFDYIAILGAKPDLLLIITIFFALNYSKNESIKAAITCGLVKDITSSLILGSYTISFVLIALFLNYHQNKFYKKKIVTQILVSFGSYIVMVALALLFNFIAHKGFIADYPILPIIFKGGAYTAFLAPLIFFIGGRLQKPDYR